MCNPGDSFGRQPNYDVIYTSDKYQITINFVCLLNERFWRESNKRGIVKSSIYRSEPMRFLLVGAH